MKKRKQTKKLCKKDYWLDLDKMIWGMAAFLGLAYMVIVTAPKLSGK